VWQPQLVCLYRLLLLLCYGLYCKGVVALQTTVLQQFRSSPAVKVTTTYSTVTSNSKSVVVSTCSLANSSGTSGLCNATALLIHNAPQQFEGPKNSPTCNYCSVSNCSVSGYCSECVPVRQQLVIDVLLQSAQIHPDQLVPPVPTYQQCL
jgi:hypothetical protein